MASGTESGVCAGGLTAELAARAVAIRPDALPGDVVELAQQCLLDWLGVTLAGAAEPAAATLRSQLVADHGADHGVTVVGTGDLLPPLPAALVNGTASHALDYDDVNAAMIGHPSVAILGALLAVAEAQRSSGAEVVAAFVAGYETACRVGRAMGTGHYERGFHATGTVGTLGAAAACARLLDLDAEATATALGLAATQAAGLKAMFGTMAKPLHAGKACTNGLLAARLAGAGFTADPTAIETAQGFADTLGDRIDVDAARRDPRDGWYLRRNLFKYHASCAETHSTIEGLRRLRAQEPFTADDVERVTVHASRLQLGMCAIGAPTTGLEIKFSLPHLAAMALVGADTGAIASFTDSATSDPAVVAVRDRVVLAEDGPAAGGTPVDVDLCDGRRRSVTVDVGAPTRDVPAQWPRLTEKFRGLAGPVLGETGAEDLAAAVRRAPHLADVAALLALSRPRRAD